MNGLRARRHPRRGGDQPDPAAHRPDQKAGIAELPDAERAAIDKAVTIVRRHRSVSLGMPAVRTAAPATATTTEATA